MTNALARAGLAVDEREAVLPQVRLLDAPAKVLQLGRDIECLDGHLGAEGIPLQPIQGKELVISCGMLIGCRPAAA
jgi:hypothetical protein